MNYKKLFLSICSILIGVFIFKVGMEVGAATSEPGSASDPLITQSYLEKRLEDFTGGSSQSFKKVSLKKGNILTADEGTELLLYSGNANIAGSKGLINTSSGELFQNGYTMVKYNNFLSPADGSGIKATTSATIFVKGSYSIN